MPELADRQPAEAGLDDEQALADDTASKPHAEPEQRERREHGEPGVVVGRHVEQRAGAEQRACIPPATLAATTSGTKRARRELEEQQLDREHDRGERRAERRRHARRGTAREQDLAFRRRDRITWPMSEPIAPPVTMIGPSAPNGAPVPMATAAETGLATAVRGAMRLCLVRTASIASGMP